jgi:energy-coupling factor transporter ATP-binding protein EcfA2
MPGTLRLPDLRIVGFRALKELEIKKLGRVNLLTGKNNSGKSSVLEALRLYAARGSKNLVLEIADARDENSGPEPAGELAALNLFHGRITLNHLARSPRFEIRPAKRNADALIAEAGRWDPNTKQFFEFGSDVAVKFQFAGRETALITSNRKETFPVPDPAQYVGSSGISPARIGEMWKGVSLTPLEDDLVACLQLISPNVDRVSVLPSDSGNRPIPFVRVRGASRPIPLRSLGDGMNRLFGIALALVNAKDEFLLIDEIENGIHYSILPQLWNFIVQNAERLNVQVFATTHSWECIAAFQRFTNKMESDGMLIRLDWRDGAVRAVEFNEDELGIATQQNIEVR